MKIETTLRWIARCTSVALATLIIILAIGERDLPPFFAFSPEALLSWLLLSGLVGSLAAWRYELWGGIAGLVGFGGFYFIIFASRGFRHFSGGWIFWAMMLIPVLYLLAWWRHRAMSEGKI